MSKPLIVRYISDEKVFEETICKDFKFLVDKIKDSGFEYYLEIREDYFNLYYQGNSIGKIVYRSSKNDYKVSINEKFVNRKMYVRFKGRNVGDYIFFVIPAKKLPFFFSVVNLRSLSQKVKDVNYQEEIAFEQMLMTDNVGRNDFVIIDRQVVDHSSREKIDLLGLKRVDGDNFQFCVLEVKLGNNKELKDAVSGQLKRYVKRIEDHFEEYKRCYEKNFEQKLRLGLIEGIEKVCIVPVVLGIIVVGGYGGLAEASIRELRNKDKDIRVFHSKNKIDFSKVEPKCN